MSAWESVPLVIGGLYMAVVALLLSGWFDRG